MTLSFSSLDILGEENETTQIKYSLVENETSLKNIFPIDLSLQWISSAKG